MGTENEPDPIVTGRSVRLSETHFVEGLTDEEVHEAGVAVLMAIGVAVSLGHNSPNGMMDYVPRPEDPMRAIVWDAFAATRLDVWKAEAQDSLIRFASQRGILDAVARAASV